MYDPPQNILRALTIYKQIAELVKEGMTIEEATKEVSARYYHVFGIQWIKKIYETVPDYIKKIETVTAGYYSEYTNFQVKAEFRYDPCNDTLRSYYSERSLIVPNDIQFIISIIGFIGSVSYTIWEEHKIKEVQILYDKNKNGYWKINLEDCKYMTKLIGDMKTLLESHLSDREKDLQSSKALSLLSDKLAWINVS